MDGPTVVSFISTVGFPIVAAVLLWKAYERMVGKMVEVVQTNTQAMQDLRAVVNQHSESVRQLSEAVERLDTSVERIERAIGLEHGGSRGR